ncbi:MAG: hypothetical protein ABSG84_10765 [Acidobacteriaceae bacterium]
MSEDPTYGPQVMGAYIASSFAGGIVIGQLENLGSGQNGDGGAYQFSMIDPSGTTHELESDASNWNIFHASDGSGYTFIPANTPNATPTGAENAYNVFAPADGWKYLDSSADWIGIPSGDPVTTMSGVRLGTLYSPTGIQYSDSIQQYPYFPSNASHVYYSDGRLETSPVYIPLALYSTEKDPSGNTIKRGPWYWSGYYSLGSVFSDIQSIYSNSSLVPPPDSNHSSGPYYVDSIGRVIPDIVALQSTMSGYGSITIPWTVPGPNGGQVSYTIKYGGIGNAITWTPGQTVGNPDPSIDISAKGWAISSVTLPNNTQWGFTYSGADIQTVTNPIGGSVSFQYTTIPVYEASYSLLGAWISGARCNGVCHAVQSRTETDGLGNSWTTRYSYGVYIPQTTTLSYSVCPFISVSQYDNEQFAFWTTETDPQGNDTVHSFCAIGLPNGIPLANEYHEVETQYYQGSAPSPQGSGNSGTLLKTVYTGFATQLDLTTPYSTTQYGGIFTAPNLITTTTPRGNLTTEVKTYSSNDGYGQHGSGQPLFVTTKIGCGQGYEGSGSVNGCSPVQANTYPYGFLNLNVSYNVPVGDTTYIGEEQNLGNPLRNITTTFEFQNPLGQAYTNANLVALPLSVTTSGGGVSGTTTYSYDLNNPSSCPGAKGNQSSKTETYNLPGSNTGGPTSSEIQISYNCQGMPTSIVDADGNAPGGVPSQHTTTTTYDGTGLFPYQIQRPTTNGVTHHIDYYSYDPNTGKLNWHTDENGSGPDDANHTTNYSYDIMGRVTSIQYPDGGGSTICYTDVGGSISGNSCSAGSAPFSLYTSTIASPDPAVSTVHSYDGWGRQYRSQMLNDSGSVTYVDTTYDWAGRVASVSNPYRGSPASLNPVCGNGYTCYTYDSLGHKKTQVQPDGSTQQWCYDGLGTYSGGQCPYGLMQTDFWDETKRHTQQQFDWLGRLTVVYEPDPVSGSLALQTGYNYDVFNDLVSVYQVGASGNTPVQRSFAYDMPSRVTWACNPEAIGSGQNCTSGTPGTQYVYDANSNLTQRTDNRGIVTNYQYDALNRLLSKIYSDSTASACYQYDGAKSSNLSGRLVAQWTQNGTCPYALPASGVFTATAFSLYDSMGRLKNEQRCTGVSNCASGGYPMTYTYDLAGKLTSYPSGFGGLTFTNAYDTVGRLATVTNTPQNALLFSQPVYTPAGALSGALLGTSISVNRTFDVRQRVTSETDIGGNTGSVPATTSLVILGWEQVN